MRTHFLPIHSPATFNPPIMPVIWGFSIINLTRDEFLERGDLINFNHRDITLKTLTK